MLMSSISPSSACSDSFPKAFKNPIQDLKTDFANIMLYLYVQSRQCVRVQENQSCLRILIQAMICTLMGPAHLIGEDPSPRLARDHAHRADPV